MRCKWSGKIDEEGKTELINILLVLYTYYLKSRDESFIALEYERNLKNILESGLIKEETKNFLEYQIKEIENIYYGEQENKNIKSLKEKNLLKAIEKSLEE